MQVLFSDCEQIVRAGSGRFGAINFSDMSTHRARLDLFRGWFLMSFLPTFIAKTHNAEGLGKILSGV